MVSHDVILTFAGGLAAALVLGYAAQRIGVSPIIGYLLAGIAVGPYTRAMSPTAAWPSSSPRSG